MMVTGAGAGTRAEALIQKLSQTHALIVDMA